MPVNEEIGGLSLRERHPDCFGPIIVESPLGKKRSVPMECLNLGFSRTGTSTMAAALEILGMHTYHSLLWFSTNLGDTDMWLEALDAKFFGKGEPFTRSDWDQLLHNFGAVSADTPTIAFSSDLISVYPEAKVVLTYRDIDAWYTSFNTSVITPLCDPIKNIFCAISPGFAGRTREPHVRAYLGWGGMKRERGDMQAKAKDLYKRHYEEVRRMTPPERLLEFRLQDGWEPLCKFLGKPVPDQPFPHLNDSQMLAEKLNLVMSKGLRDNARKALPWLTAVSVTLLGVVWYYRSVARQGA